MLGGWVGIGGWESRWICVGRQVGGCRMDEKVGV